MRFRLELEAWMREFVLGLMLPAVYLRTFIFRLLDDSDRTTICRTALSGTQDWELGMALLKANEDAVKQAGGRVRLICTDGDFVRLRRGDDSSPSTPLALVDSALAIVAEIEKEIAAKVALKFPPKPPAAVPVFDVTVTDHPLADV